MVKHYTRSELVRRIHDILGNAYECRYRGHGRAGNLLEELLGISGGNYDVADAVGFEIKTAYSSSTPITLFHKDPLPRNKKDQLGALNNLVMNYGWDSEHHGETVKSFRATLFGKWVNIKGDITLRVCADDDRIRILHDEKEVAWWDSNELVGIASAKLRNILYVNAEALPDGRIKFTEAQIFETFAPLNFIRALNEGTVAIDFDARSNPNKNSIRNHGTKFRIRERDILKIYQNILPL